MNILVHVDANGGARLLQRVAAGVDADGKMRLFKELESAKAACENPRRLSSVMMSVDTPVVAASAHTTFGDQLQFAWTVDAKARDNPFRHAWHPDHDGKTADYSGDVVSGDDLANYVNPVKPELWSVTNTLYLSWHKLNNPTEDVDFEHNPNERPRTSISNTTRTRSRRVSPPGRSAASSRIARSTPRAKPSPTDRSILSAYST